MKHYSQYTHRFVLPVEPDVAFGSMADPRRLDSVTPAWFRLRPASVPPSLSAGTEVTYHLRWRSIPLPWTSRIVEWSEPRAFIYEQLRGPFRFFRHEHFFTEVSQGTEVVDRVIFRCHGGRLVDRWLALPDLRSIFEFREARVRQLLVDRSRDSEQLNRPREPTTGQGVVRQPGGA